MRTKTEGLPVTHKKQKFVGIEELVNPKTGEIIPMQMCQVEERDFNFHKIWLQMFVQKLDIIANKKMKLAFWIIDHLDKENRLVYTLRRIAEKTGLHLDTVAKTMKALQEGEPPFLKKVQSGVYIVNPDILYKGSHHGRMGIVYDFSSIQSKAEKERIEEWKEEQNETIETSMEKLLTMPQEKIPRTVEIREDGSMFYTVPKETAKEIAAQETGFPKDVFDNLAAIHIIK